MTPSHEAMPVGRSSGLDALERKLGYGFTERGLLARALTHKSASADNFERLEFLGDAAIGYLVAVMVFESAPDATEQRLTLMRARLVNGETLAAVARELDLGVYLKLGEGERRTGGADRDSILADALEAVVGAVVRDGGIGAAKTLVAALLGPRLARARGTDLRDPKTRLQEHAQAAGHDLPSYVVVRTAGEDHAPVYSVECALDGLGVRARGEGRSRRAAEKRAASQALGLLGLDAGAD